MQKTLTFFLIVVGILLIGGIVLAQDTPIQDTTVPATTGVDDTAEPVLISANPTEETTVDADVEADETVDADELDLKEPSLLPDSRFYFLKNWGRGIRSIFTFGKVKEAELKQKFASERLLEARALATKKDDSEILEKATERYEAEMEKVRKMVNEMEDNTSTSDQVSKFLDKFVHQQLLHTKILEKLESQVPTSTMERIRATRENHLIRFGEVMEKLEQNKERITERINEGLDSIKGSEFKDFKDIETLKKIEEKVSENAREAIQKAREKSMEKLEEKLEKATGAVQEKFEKYAEKIKGVAEDKMEILEDMRLRFQNQIQVESRIQNAKDAIMNRVRTQTEEKTGQRCPLNMINPYSCEGRVITEKDANGCPVTSCIELGEDIDDNDENDENQDENNDNGAIKERERACITLWDPVCGADGNTYSNKCFAELKNVRIVSRGACRKPQTIQINPEVSNVQFEAEPVQKGANQ